MQLRDISYGGKYFRPKPEFQHNTSTNLLIIATPWSSKKYAQNTIEIISNFYSTLSSDKEATTPFERLPQYNSIQNNLRTSILLAHNEITKNLNQTECVNGCELFVAIQSDQLFSYIQIGNPSLFIQRNKSQFISLGSQKDLSFDFSMDKLLPPLPDQLFGVSSRVDFTVNSFRLQPGDKAILLSHSEIGQLTQRQLLTNDIDTMAKKISKESENSPFWLGEVIFSL